MAKDKMLYKSDFKNRFGVSVSTARNRLMRSIIFDLLNKLGQNKCHRCNQIMTLETFSIEHIIPWAWEEKGLELFMNISNISFSHILCNSSHTRRNTNACEEAHARKRKFKDDKVKCKTCDEWKSINEFHKNKAQPSGTHPNCKTCRNLERRK